MIDKAMNKPLLGNERNNKDTPETAPKRKTLVPKIRFQNKFKS